MASHSSGIPVDSSLDLAFGTAREGNSIRFIKAQIVEDKIVQTSSQKVSGSEEQDFPSIQPHLEGRNPCYIIYRLDSSNIHGNEWLLISYVPDGSPVKSRMLYASSLGILKLGLGMTYFADELHCSATDDITWVMYQQHSRKKGIADAPLTQAEISRGQEVELAIDHGHSREYVHSVRFPMSSEAVSALKNFDRKPIVQLELDINKETIELHATLSGSVDVIANNLPKDKPLFTFFQFEHEHEEKTVKPIIFIYSCPNEAPVKAKMLYSTVKAAAIDAATQLGVTLDKKIEITGGDELVESELLNELHPEARTINVKTAFNRPPRPGGARAPRTRK